jgi:hypothetical protein
MAKNTTTAAAAKNTTATAAAKKTKKTLPHTPLNRKFIEQMALDAFLRALPPPPGAKIITLDP